MTQQPDLYQRFLTQPAHRERGRVVAPDGEWTPERRARFGRWMCLAAVSERYLIHNPAVVNRWLFVRFLREVGKLGEGDAYLALDAAAALVTLSVVWKLWLGFGS